ncbi:MAG TPA: carboxylesterase family protein, partial [Edaphobacter sp.]
GVVVALMMAPKVGLAANPLVVKTDKGKVEGALTANGKVAAFKGIPYAAPPVGKLRWREPQPAAKWKGVRAAKEFGSRCMQQAAYPDMIFHDPGQSEDCLTLNVWAPAGAKQGTLPVMVWIYGGGFQSGSTSEARQDGQYLAQRNVVVVSMNYRMGVLGFFTHPELTAESPHHASGNYGLLDQAEAIAWVKNNIAQFGGDPKNITIFGESAGSISVSAQMASPLTKDLIAKAIGESGGALVLTENKILPREVTEKRDAAFAETALHAKDIKDLRNIPAEDLLKAVTDRANHAPRFWPVVDGYFLPDSAANIYAQGKQAHIPLIAGWNANEGHASPVKSTLAGFREQAQKEFGADSDKFLGAYAATTDEEAHQAAGDFAGDQFIAYATWRWLESHTETGSSPVYRYFLTLPSPGDKFHPAAAGAFHSDDIEYVFGTLDSRQGAVWRPEDRKLSDQIQQYWTNFARTGDPNSGDLPKWPTYNAGGGWPVMYFNADSQAKPDAYRERYAFLDSVWGKPKSESVAGR